MHILHKHPLTLFLYGLRKRRQWQGRGGEEREKKPERGAETEMGSAAGSGVGWGELSSATGGNGKLAGAGKASREGEGQHKPMSTLHSGSCEEATG